MRNVDVNLWFKTLSEEDNTNYRVFDNSVLVKILNVNRKTVSSLSVTFNAQMRRKMQKIRIVSGNVLNELYDIKNYAVLALVDDLHSLFSHWGRTYFIRTFFSGPVFSWILTSCHLENLKLQIDRLNYFERLSKQRIIFVRKWDEKFLRQTSMLVHFRVLWISEQKPNICK